MDVLVERLDAKLREWEPNTVAEVRRRVAEIIDLADQDLLDIMQSRFVEQEVWLANLGLAAKTRPIRVSLRC